MSIRKQKIKDFILKRRGFFSLDQIVEETHLTRKIIQDILDSFAKDGLIRESKRPETIGRPGIYRINRVDEGDNLAANRMWKVIRYKREFGLRDLIILANTKRETARAFLKSLRRAGYIESNKPTGRGVYWTLIKDPGPKRPYVGDQVKSARRKGD